MLGIDDVSLSYGSDGSKSFKIIFKGLWHLDYHRSGRTLTITIGLTKIKEDGNSDTFDIFQVEVLYLDENDKMEVKFLAPNTPNLKNEDVTILNLLHVSLVNHIFAKLKSPITI